MRQFLILAIAFLVIAGFAARYLDRAVAPPPARAAAVQAEQPAPSGRSLSLVSGRDGHFEAEARIEGQRLAFIVDTGATMVIIRESDAARIGVRPARGDYTATVSTANGKIKAAPARLDRVEVGGISVDNVAALVLPDEALWKNLLGMSFLSRLKRYEAANGRIVLEQ